MASVQMWLVSTFASVTPIGRLMHTTWGWPIAESLHFIGLSLLIGTVGLFDLRLLGLARRIPVEAMHKLIPWGVMGFGLNVITGLSFLLAEPDQYVYNPAFQFKMLFVLVAGCNALAFYLTSYRRPMGTRVKIIAGVSLSLWIAVIVAGRLLTFYRPFPCEPSGPGFLATCIPGYGNKYSTPAVREPAR